MAPDTASAVAGRAGVVTSWAWAISQRSRMNVARVDDTDGMAAQTAASHPYLMPDSALANREIAAPGPTPSQPRREPDCSRTTAARQDQAVNGDRHQPGCEHALV